jgi:hypothetical protein
MVKPIHLNLNLQLRIGSRIYIYIYIHGGKFVTIISISNLVVSLA